jgi:hypothetical protein
METAAERRVPLFVARRIGVHESLGLLLAGKAEENNKHRSQNLFCTLDGNLSLQYHYLTGIGTKCSTQVISNELSPISLFHFTCNIFYEIPF